MLITQTQDYQHYQHHKGYRQQVQARPADYHHALTGKQAAHRSGAEDHKLVDALHLALLYRLVSVGQQMGTANKGEVPANAYQRQANQEVTKAVAQQMHGHRQQQQATAPQNYAARAEAPDQVAGKKRRYKHAQYMPLNY